MRKSPTAAILGLNELVSSGQIVAASDYPGLGTSGPIGYLIGKGQAYAVIDSVRATRQIPDIGGSNRYALWGYSQGGHAALFAAHHSLSYAPELKLVGVAATAPPTDLGKLLIANLGTLEGRVLTSFTLGSWARKYGLALESLAERDTVSFIDKLNQNCIDDFAGQMDTFAAQKPLSDQFLIRNPLMLPQWSPVVSENSIFNYTGPVPALIVQGDRDHIVHPSVTQKFVTSSCRGGAIIKYIVLRAKDHGSSAKASVGSTISWLNERFRDVPASSSCRQSEF